MHLSGRARRPAEAGRFLGSQSALQTVEHVDELQPTVIAPVETERNS
jgi:hypothetical protein